MTTICRGYSSDRDNKWKHNLIRGCCTLAKLTLIDPRINSLLPVVDTLGEPHFEFVFGLLNPRNEDSPIGGKELPPAKYWPLDY